MKALKLNADYESELFFGKSLPPIVNQSLEFLIFFLTDAPLYSQKVYSAEYLEYVQKITSHEPKMLRQGEYSNWWGLLNNLPSERWWNSKLTSAELIIQKGWCERTFILKSDQEIPEINGEVLLKDPFGMSGQKFQVTSHKQNILHFPLILEPFFNRKFDFSQYVFPDGKIIAYENIVDEKFQYKGSIFSRNNRLEDLSFYPLIDEKEWAIFKKRISEVMEFYGRYPNEIGYSIDSFVYEENGKLKIRTLSEINYRRTMGRVAFELSRLYFPSALRSTLQLLKPVAGEPLWKRYENEQNKLVLSPGDTRFEILLLADT